jgi:Na+-translocating ferredoxin:NAD+ oxidoreductase subunit D
MTGPLLSSSPHGHQGFNTSNVMLLVLLACVPGFTALCFFFGWGVLFNVLWLSLLALGFEAFVLKLRNKPIGFYLRDYSALVTAVLLGLALPATAPWWLGLIGIFFAIVIAKHLYGGMGYNPFNPAMVGYVVLLVSFPVQMTRWLLPAGVSNGLPDFSTAVTMFLDGEVLTGIDAYTGATALDVFRQQQGGAQLVSEFWQQTPVMGQWSGAGWEWINVGFLFGGLYLLFKRLINWHIPVAMLSSIALLSLLFYDGGSSVSHGSPLLHLFGGATMLGAFFIATDPVTAATTPRGRLIYGALIGTVVYAIRAWGNYPDGVAFGVLIGNFAAPLIDAYTRPRTYGHQA